MKQLLAFTALLAAGYALGNRRARKHGPVDVVSMAVEVDTTQATAALKELEARAVHAQRAVSALTDSCSPTVQYQIRVTPNGADLVSALELQADRLGRVVGQEPGRCTGQTTRLVDAAVQTLFTAGEVRVRDHVDHRPTHKLLYEKVVARLHLEHPRDLFIFNDRALKIQLPSTVKSCV